MMRNEFDYKPVLSVQQFLTMGFVERKMILVCDLIALCKNKHYELYRAAVLEKKRFA